MRDSMDSWFDQLVGLIDDLKDVPGIQNLTITRGKRRTSPTPQSQRALPQFSRARTSSLQAIVIRRVSPTVRGRWARRHEGVENLHGLWSSKELSYLQAKYHAIRVPACHSVVHADGPAPQCTHVTYVHAHTYTHTHTHTHKRNTHTHTRTHNGEQWCGMFDGLGQAHILASNGNLVFCRPG